MDGTIIQQGRFTSDGAQTTLDIRSDVDWIEVINETQWATTQATGRGVKFQWQRGMTAGHAFEVTKADNTNVMQAEKVTSGGFTLTGAESTAIVTGTTITKAGPPVCTANGHGFSNNDIVLFTNLTNMPQIALVGFTINNVATNTFELPYFDTNTANFTQEAAFEVRRAAPFSWRGAWTNITSVTTGTTTQIQGSAQDVEINYPVGEVLTFSVPSEYGMIQLDGLQGEVLSHNTTTNTYTVDIDSTGFTAFAWPASTAVPFSLPTIRPEGTVATTSTGSVTNLDSIGIILSAGIDGPAGSTSDVIYWRAGKSFSVSNG